MVGKNRKPTELEKKKDEGGEIGGRKNTGVGQ